eukprot:Plantae.Rhodophyta-Purpureofilum_apyrenoidigerum.ctg15629.p1 GENE.Plantae.Rhodophyta-Purpureofilum_apyrenoidigerum.ctg15629~~Plantae.Rhodophyta-Purpureofilum_apyrenoidigerum.ctg15629.p1  ORF type:complete len:368 (-),score=65.28 Plantae.Rhodophyta-Purpureofilum_apyrenoidigerum.ctg15629:678-1781(-)
MDQFLIMTPAPPTDAAPPSVSMEISDDRAMEQDSSRDESMDLLPDDIICLCLVNLTAKDLAHVEMLSKRLREVVYMNPNLWQDMVRQRWGMSANAILLERAARYAGGWKSLYSEKHRSEKKDKQWVIPTKYEVEAMLEVIRGGDKANTSAIPSSQGSSYVCDLSGSPTSILSDGLGGRRKRSLTVLVLLDGSSSVTRDDFETMKGFTCALITSLRKFRSDSGVGVIQFNQSPRTMVPITNVQDDSIASRVNKMQQLNGSTDIAAPIRSSYELLREDGNFGGDAVVLLLSDGQTSTAELEMSQREATRAAQELGVKLFAFGVGREVDEIGLHRIATSTRIEANSSGLFQPERPGGAYFTLRRMERSVS